MVDQRDMVAGTVRILLIVVGEVAERMVSCMDRAAVLQHISWRLNSGRGTHNVPRTRIREIPSRDAGIREVC